MYIDVRGHKTYAATGGKEFDNSLPTVMFVHGSGLDHRSWALQTRWFAYNGYSVLAPDLPGHSLSQGEPLSSIEDMGAWLADFLRTVGVSKVHAIGHSQGFLDVLELARQAPELLKSITGIGTAGAIPVNPALIDAAKKSAADAADMLLMWGFGADAQYGISAVPGMQPIAIGRQIMASNPLHADLVACGEYDNGSEVAKSINLPSQLILARKDRLTPVRAGQAFAEELNARVSVIERYGHMLPIEAPRQTLQKLRELIGSLEKAA
ncbi:MAG: alpha/beta hydrolase [Gammaproteobacteria bacterium]|nr:alpha/beta hydrolase [Gammaproteobacteria bacterium]MCP4877516.1 alpha/beta hydrolase [Gammaproteobacteria bacterium]MCP4981356.1 alpha/beta hydrolase [Gammaproteobacteria bacterium]